MKLWLVWVWQAFQDPVDAAWATHAECAKIVRWFDFNSNFTDEMFWRFQACVTRRAELPDWRSSTRPSLLSGEDFPVSVTPSAISPPAYWVLPAFDYVVSNFVRKHGTYDPGELLIYKHLIKKGDVVCDVGAHVGSYTVPLASHVGRTGTIHAFEPFRLVFQMLIANVALNGISNVHGHQLALGEKEEIRTVLGPALDQASNVGATRVFNQEAPHFGYQQVLQYGETETVRVAPLDSLGLGRVDFLKVDAEGSLGAALGGARRTIAEHRPLLAVEHEGSEAPQTLLNWGYRCVLALSLHSLWVCVPGERFDRYMWLDRLQTRNGKLTLEAERSLPAHQGPPNSLRMLQSLGLEL